MIFGMYIAPLLAPDCSFVGFYMPKNKKKTEEMNATQQGWEGRVVAGIGG